MRQSSFRTSFRTGFRPAAIALLVTGGLLCTQVAAQSGTSVEVNAHALQTPESRGEGGQALDSAVAASLIGAISSQFGEHKVEVTLDDVSVGPLSLRDRDVTGHGRLRIGDDPEWIPVAFQALYDTETTAVSVPALVLGSETAGEPIALESDIARGLDHQVNAALNAEFAQQPVHLSIERVAAAATNTRFVQVTALGTADFSEEGSTPAQVRALYDRDTGKWLRVDYELGTDSNWTQQGESSVAIN